MGARVRACPVEAAGRGSDSGSPKIRLRLLLRQLQTKPPQRGQNQCAHSPQQLQPPAGLATDITFILFSFSPQKILCLPCG